MNIDDLTTEFIAEPGGQYLHETCEHGEFHILLDKNFFDVLESFFFLVAIQVDLMEGDSGFEGDVLAVVTVANDGSDLNGHFTQFGAPEDFVEAVVGFGHQHGGAHLVG